MSAPEPVQDFMQEKTSPSDGSAARFLSDVTMTFGVRVVSMVIGVATGIIVARVLGPTGRGAYALIAAFPALVLAFVHLGIAQANVYFLRKARPRVEPAVIRANTIFLTLTISCVALLGLWLLRPLLLSTALKDLEPKYYWLIMVVTPFFILETFASSLLAAYERFKLINAISFLLRILDTVAIVIVLLIFGWGLMGAALVLVGIMVLNGLITFFFAFRERPILGAPELAAIGRSLRFGLKSHIQTLTGFLHYKIDLFLLALFLSTTEVGYYSIAVSLVSLIFFIPESIGFVLFPRLASLDDADANEFTMRVCRNSLFVTALPAVGILLLGRLVIGTLYGNEYLPACAALYLLLPGVIAMSIYKVVGRNFTSQNKQEITIAAGLLGLLLNVVLNVALISRIGIAGAALATTVSYSASTAVVLGVFLKQSRRKFRDAVLINQSDFGKWFSVLRAVPVHRET